VANQKLRSHTLPRMFPFLLFVATYTVASLLEDYVHVDWRLTLALGTVPPIAVWLIATRAGRRPPPRIPTWLAVPLVAGYFVTPVVTVLAVLWSRAAEVNADYEATYGEAIDVRSPEFQIVYTVVVLMTLGVLYGLAVVATRYGFVALVLRAARHVAGDLRNSLGLLGRALPAMLFITMFLFFTGEMWQLTNQLANWRLIGLLGLFVGITVLAIGARLREELTDLEHDLNAHRLVEACHGTPLEHAAPDVAPSVRLVELRRTELLNLLLVLAARQLVRATVVGLGVFVFFMVFGLLAVSTGIASTWMAGVPVEYGWVPGVPVAMLKLTVLLSGFATMYFAVSSMTDGEYRQRFFASILDDIRRMLAVRSIYLTLREGSIPTRTPPTRSAILT
jgi:hypothetical protein